MVEVQLPDHITSHWISTQGKRILRNGNGDLRIQCNNLQEMNSLTLAWLVDAKDRLEKQGRKLILSNIPPRLQPEIGKAVRTGYSPQPREGITLPVALGHGANKLWGEMKSILLLLSESVYWSTLGAFRSKTILPGETMRQMSRLGSSALPIVLLLSFLIGFTLALQSGIQLEKFGATIFLASGIGISMVTEIGPVMTAVILAGRSGSAITAEISTMVVQEELGALHTMAINPIHFLVLPRFWAMSLTLPLLTVCSAMVGILAGLTVAVFFFQLSVTSFLTELRSGLSLDYVVQALIKSLTFAWIITLVAVTKGVNVRGGADAVGKATTSCVVTCIFAIILADALFSFVFYV